MNALKDNNGRPAIIAVSNADGKTIQRIYANDVLLVDDNTTGSDLGSNQGNALIDESGVSVLLAESTLGLVELYTTINGELLINSN